MVTAFINDLLKVFELCKQVNERSLEGIFH
jgi:hypothetical protein